MKIRTDLFVQNQEKMQGKEKVWDVDNILRKVFSSVADVKTKSKKLITKEETEMRKVHAS